MGRTPPLVTALATVAVMLVVPIHAPARGVIAFGVYDTPGTDIAMMDESGGTQRMLTEREATVDLGPFWSLDGSKIGFTSRSRADFKTGDYDVFAMDADGSNVRNLTRTPDMKERGHAWTPDGRHILITEGRLVNSPLPDNDEGMYLMDIDTGAKVAVGDPKGRRPSLSTDGTKLVYGLGVTNQPWMGLYTVDLRTGERTRLTFDYTVPVGAPVWSPDGTRIAYLTSRGGGNLEIHVMDADGTNATRVARWPHATTQPTWSPDGGSIMFASVPALVGDFRVDGIYIADLDTGRRARVVINELTLSVGGPSAKLTGVTAWWGPELQTLAVSPTRKRASTWAALKSR